MKFEWITDWDTIWSEEFQTLWLEWIEKSDNSHVFFHPIMVRAWIDTYLPIRKIEPLFCIAREEDTVIFFPLVLWTKNWKNAYLRTIIPTGYSDYDYHDPILVSNQHNFDWNAYWTAFFSEIADSWNGQYDLIETDGIRNNAIPMKSQWIKGEICPFIDLSPFSDGESFLQSLKKNLRQDTKRRIRRMEESGECVFNVFSPTQVNEALETLPSLLEHHSLRWPNAYKAPRFHENLIRQLLPKGLLHFSTITINGSTISWRIGFMFQSRYYSYMPAFDIAYNSFSPGKVHLYYCIQDAINKNLKIYDQLRGDELYKNEWTQTIDTVWHHIQKKDTPKTWLKLTLCKLKNDIR